MYSFALRDVFPRFSFYKYIVSHQVLALRALLAALQQLKLVGAIVKTSRWFLLIFLSNLALLFATASYKKEA